VLNDRPTLRWHFLSNVEVYTVTLASDDGKQRPVVTVRFPSPSRGGAREGVELAYPEAWPSLEAGGVNYQLRVEGGGRRSEKVDTFRQGFSLLDPDKAARVRNQVERLRRRPLTEPALTLLLGELHLSYDLRSEAVEMLEFLPGGDQVAAIQQLLGETYLTMGLFAEAEMAFERALALAQAAGLPEAEAVAHFGLGQAACGQWKGARAEEQWRAAQAQYQALEMAARADEATKWLENATEKCSKGGAANE